MLMHGEIFMYLICKRALNPLRHKWVWIYLHTDAELDCFVKMDKTKDQENVSLTRHSNIAGKSFIPVLTIITLIWALTQAKLSHRRPTS